MKSMHRYTRRFLASVMLAGGVGVAVAPMARAQNAVAAMPSLVTSGQGEAKVTPDRASVLVNVQTRAATAAASASENAQRTRAVIDALLKLGLPKEQVTTEGYTVYPEMRYDNTGGSPRVTGYVVTNTVRAETHRPEQAGAIVDAALGAGANVINSLSFYASSIEEPRRQAIALAVASARADAEAMARAAGGSLGGLLELSTQGPTMPPRPMFDAGMMRAKVAQADPTPINAGQLTITVFVTARWQFVSGR
ncbi:MAG: SIMPL domain-containing protein [Gemmatimonadota bacterium]|nr:SIMPL domain-containing protein [Gemmatimonadota bacterium]